VLKRRIEECVEAAAISAVALAAKGPLPEACIARVKAIFDCPEHSQTSPQTTSRIVRAAGGAGGASASPNDVLVKVKV
jgi:hypothetical protein